MYQGKANDGFQAKRSSTWHEIGIYQVAAREELWWTSITEPSNCRCRQSKILGRTARNGRQAE
jgi:hypothetical protein